MTFLEELSAFISIEGLLEPGQPVVVGVSGGPDSLCLLDSLHRLGYPLVVAHFDHGLRPESGDEARRVQQMARDRGVPFESERWALGEERYLPEGSLEAAARHARYRFLLRVASERSVHRVATGHHADDQIETVLMHLLQGAGPDGLRGMAPVSPIGSWPEFGPMMGRKVDLVRPLLPFGREQIVAYCERHGLEPVIDPSNVDRRFLRNRVRHELLEILETYNPEVRQALLRMSRIMGDVTDLLDGLVDEAWESTIRDAGESALAIDPLAFGDLPVAIQRRLLRRALWRLDIDARDSGYPTIERLRSAMLGDGPRHLSIADGADAELVGNEWILSCLAALPAFPNVPQLNDAEEQLLPETGNVELASGWCLAIERRPSDADRPVELSDDMRVAFDSDRIGGPLVVRAPRVGERMAPFGMTGSVKLSDVFIDRKIPRRYRQRWPVIVDGDDVLWLVGLRRGRKAAMDLETQRVVQITLCPPDARSHTKHPPVR